MKRLLLLHPDREVYAAVERTLTRVGVSTDAVETADDVMLHLENDHHGVIVVDRVLAGSRINEIIDALRNRTATKPIVIVTSTEGTDLDPNIVSLIVPASYDVPALVGVILACSTEPTTAPEEADAASTEPAAPAS